MLGHALDQPAWDDAEAIVRALDAYWDTRGLGEEAAAWADRILAPPRPRPGHPSSTPAGALWLYTTDRAGQPAGAAGQLDQAAQTYRAALAMLQDQPETDWSAPTSPSSTTSSA